MGISAGWRDDYPYTVAYQWVDVSELLPGRYRLGAEVDPDGIFLEADESNPLAFSEPTTIVPGYLPAPQQLGGLNPFVTSKIRLKASSFVRDGGTLGPASFAAVSGPSCGRLSLAADGGASLDPVVEYTPSRRCGGEQSFEFSVRDSTSAFPLTPPSARVSFSVGSRDALGRPRASRSGRRLVLRVRSRYSGRVKLSAAKGRLRLGGCSAPASADRRAVCRIRLSDPELAALRGGDGRIRLRGLRLGATLRIAGKIVDRRRAALG
jgi:Lysyl oxidase